MNSVEEDVNNLIEELTKVRPDELSTEGLKLFNKINEIIDKNKELEEKWDKDTHKLQNALDLENADKINNYIPVSLVEEKIEELEAQYKIALEENSTKAFILKCQITILQELLEGRK